MKLFFVTADHFRQLWVRLRYPKIFLLAFLFVVVYLVITRSGFAEVRAFVPQMGYFGTFIAGMLYTYAFTSAPATGILFLAGETQHFVIGALIGGLGAIIGDLLIFKFIRLGFDDEIERLRQSRFVEITSNGMPAWLKKYLVPILGCVIIASPLPDEIGVSMLAFSTMSTRIFLLLSYILNTLGIGVILYLGAIAG